MIGGIALICIPAFAFKGTHYLGQFTRPGGIVRDTVDEHRAWVHAFFAELASQVGHPDPQEAASRLAMIWDAAAVTACFGDPDAAAAHATTLAAGVLSERN